MSRYNGNSNRGRGGSFRGTYGNFSYGNDRNYNNRSFNERPNYNNSNNSRGGISGVKNNIRQPVAVKEPDSLPPPPHLSKTSSEIKNDPLYFESFFPTPSEELVAIAEEVTHTPGLDGLNIMIEETYENFSAHHFNFKRNVSHGMYAYYIATLAWARVLKLQQQNKYSLNTQEREFVSILYEQGNYVLPKSIGMYLSALGNFQLPSGSQSKFKLPSYSYDANGYFEEFQNDYALTASFPNMSIYAQRIMQDILFTAGEVNDPDWNVNDINLPWNKRCLGYAPSVELTNSQLTILSRCHITGSFFPSDTQSFLLNIALMNAVMKHLLEVPSLESSPLPASVAGSQGQMVTEVLCSGKPINDLGAMTFKSTSPLMIPSSLSYLGGSFLFRVRKEDASVFMPFDKEHPTIEDIRNINKYYSKWIDILMNNYHFENVPFMPQLRIKKICSIDIKMASA